MKTATLTNSITCAVVTVCSLLTLGLFTPAFAGPERISDAKDKVQMVEQPEEPKWYVSLGVGTDIDTGATDFSNGFSGSFFVNSGVSSIDSLVNTASTAGTVIINPGRFEGAEIDIRSREWGCTYSDFVRARLEVGRRICSCFEVFGTFEYTHAEGDLVRGSHLELLFTNGNIDIPFYSRFSDYNAFGGELGARWYPVFRNAPVRPYVTLSAGATWVDSIDLHTWTNFFGQNITIFRDTFYDSSIVGTGTGLLGLESRVTRSFSVGVDAGLRYQTTLCPATLFDISSMASGNTSGSSSSSNIIAGLNNLNQDAGDRLTIPVTFWAKLKF